ncbi:MAG TPA: hypothetical protein V6D17_19465 [Candidatus Obscuribacterales bacterium]
MNKINLADAVAFGNAAFAQADKAEALYVQLVEKLYQLGEDIAARVEEPERVADALLKAAQAYLQRRGGYKLAEKGLVTACRIYANVGAGDGKKLAETYRLLGHVCCRQGKHCQALKYNTLAALLGVRPQTVLDTKGR